MTTTRIDPRKALYKGPSPIILPSCEHFAGTERFMKKAVQLQDEQEGAFDVTFDLEDGAQVSNSDAQLELVVTMLNESHTTAGRRGVRVGSLKEDFTFVQIEAILKQTNLPSYITLPKVETVAQVERVAQIIQTTCGSKKSPRLHILIETHQALHDVWQIAAHPIVEVLDFGLMDFISAHHGAIDAAAMHSPRQFAHPIIISAKTAIATAAIAHGKVASHNVCVNYNSVEQTFDDARRARHDFGYMRMWSIHPLQIAPIISAFTASEDEIAYAEELLCRAQDAQWGPIAFKDTLHDRASYRYYWSILERTFAHKRTKLSNHCIARFFPAAS